MSDAPQLTDQILILTKDILLQASNSEWEKMMDTQKQRIELLVELNGEEITPEEGATLQDKILEIQRLDEEISKIAEEKKNRVSEELRNSNQSEKKDCKVSQAYNSKD
ncbi:MAG: flagellar protein FliT [Cellvibrionaceae bacterium]